MRSAYERSRCFHFPGLPWLIPALVAHGVCRERVESSRRAGAVGAMSGGQQGRHAGARPLPDALISTGKRITMIGTLRALISVPPSRAVAQRVALPASSRTASTIGFTLVTSRHYGRGPARCPNQLPVAITDRSRDRRCAIDLLSSSRALDGSRQNSALFRSWPRPECATCDRRGTASVVAAQTPAC